MKKILLLAFCLISISSFAQDIKPMNKKETKEFVNVLQNYVSVGKFQEAMAYVDEKESRINLKAFSKSEKVWWDSTKEELNMKKALFEKNKGIVDNAQKYYQDYEFRKCYDSIKDLSLDNTSAYSESIEKLKRLNTGLESKIGTMTQLDDQMNEIESLYNSSKWEELFKLRDIDHILGYVSLSNRGKMKEIVNKVDEVYKGYTSSWERSITEPENFLAKDICSLGNAELKKCLELSNKYLSLTEVDVYYPEENFPILKSRRADVLKKLQIFKEELESRIRESDPRKTIMAGTKATRNQILSDCEGNVPDLLSIIKLDVLKYYNLSFKTELQKDNYTRTYDYIEKLEQLKRLREEVLNTVYYQKLNVETGAYSVKDNCFYIEVGTNNGVNMPWLKICKANPPGAIGEEGKEVVHNSLKIAYFNMNFASLAYTNGDKFYLYKAAIPVPRHIASNYENRKCEMIICFTPSGVKEYQYTGAEYDSSAYHIFNVKKEYPYSNICRVFLFDKNGDCFYDGIIK